MFSHASSDRSIDSSLSQLRVAMLNLGLWSENRREYMSEITCLCGSVLVHNISNDVSGLE